MLNLLPQTEKKRLISEYRIRFGITVASFACLLLIVAIVGLFPSYMSKRSELKFLLEQKEQAEEKNSEASLEEGIALAASNKALVDYLEIRVGVLRDSPKVTEIVSKALAKRTAGISLRAIDVVGKQVTLRGVAATRAELIGFHSALREESLFKTSTLPIADIAKSTDAEFAINITLP